MSTTAQSNAPMRDVMVDLETMGSGYGCVILSIGAVAFDGPNQLLGERFHVVVNTGSCLALGLVQEPLTMDWWSKQSLEAQKLIAEAENSPTSVRQALQAYSDFLARNGGARFVRPWSNGADFDNAILSDLYRRLDLTTPWAHWNSRCFRTLKNLSGLREHPRAGIHHNALDDAIHQANHACRILADMSGRKAAA